MATFISLRTHFRQTTFTIPAKMTYCYEVLENAPDSISEVEVERVEVMNFGAGVYVMAF